MMQTERLLKHALQEKIPVTLCINKIDRLILELKLPPNDAYSKIRYTLDSINQMVLTFALDDAPIFSPLNRNVIFASSRFNICFSVDSFAELYSSKYRKSTPLKSLQLFTTLLF
jgi:U5 small nuclear ribonucleoprotein component